MWPAPVATPKSAMKVSSVSMRNKATIPVALRQAHRVQSFCDGADLIQLDQNRVREPFGAARMFGFVRKMSSPTSSILEPSACVRSRQSVSPPG